MTHHVLLFCICSRHVACGRQKAFSLSIHLETFFASYFYFCLERIFFIYFWLKDNCFTVLHWFLSNINMPLENLVNMAPTLVIKQFRQLMPLLMMMMMVRRNNCLYGAATEWDDVCKIVEWTYTWGPVSDCSCCFLLSQDSFSSWWPLQSHTRTQRFLNVILSWWLCCQKFFFF